MMLSWRRSNGGTATFSTAMAIKSVPLKPQHLFLCSAMVVEWELEELSFFPEKASLMWSATWSPVVYSFSSNWKELAML